MIRKFKPFAALALCALACTLSCTQRTRPDEGRVRFVVRPGQTITDVTRSQLSDYASLPDASSFDLEIRDSYSDKVWSGKVSEWTGEITFPIGTYTVAANYGSTSVEGFGTPCLRGTGSFTVASAGEQDVEIGVSTANSLVRISCTEAFRNYFPERSFVVRTGAKTEIPFPSTETRAAFIDPYKFSVSGSLTTQGGKAYSLQTEEFTGLKPATCYTVVMDVANVGGVSVSVSFNDTVQNIQLEVELND